MFLRPLARQSHRLVRTTRLQGPPGESFFYGVCKNIFDARDMAAKYKLWEKEYGLVYAIPSILGSTRVVLGDPKGISHLHSKVTTTYVQTPGAKARRAKFPGQGLLWAEGREHSRQRKSLTPAFSPAFVKGSTPAFYNLAYKMKRHWGDLIESESGNGDRAVIEIQGWMNKLSLDIICTVGFSRDYGALDGKHSSVIELFGAVSAHPRPSILTTSILLLSDFFPSFASIPLPHMNLLQKFGYAMEDISDTLLADAKKERGVSVTEGKETQRSIIGELINGAHDKYHLTREEVMAQMKVTLLTGCETIAVSLTWTLLELSRNSDIQTKLRNELLEYDTDPSHDQFSDLPYLDAVVHEILRVHPPLTESTRIAAEDDIIPLSKPVRTESGALVDNVTIAKDTIITIPIESVNCSVAIWGEDALRFRPDRWLEHKLDQHKILTKECYGYRNLLTFSDGPRMCLGKNFAVTELKAVLTVLVKNFVFEPRDSVDSKIEIVGGVLPRPKIAGEVACEIPLLVRKYIA